MSGLKDYGFSFVRKFEFQGAPMDAQEIREELVSSGIYIAMSCELKA